MGWGEGAGTPVGHTTHLEVRSQRLLLHDDGPVTIEAFLTFQAQDGAEVAEIHGRLAALGAETLDTTITDRPLPEFQGSTGRGAPRP